MRDVRLHLFLSAFCVVIYAVAASVGAFTGGIWATLGLGLAGILFLGVGAVDKKLPLSSRRFALFTVATLTIFAAELPLSAYPDISAHLWVQLVSVFVTLLCLTSQRLQQICLSRHWLPVAAIAMATGAGALGLELASGGFVLNHIKKPPVYLTEYNRGMAHLALLAFPICAGLWVTGRRKPAAVLALLLLFPASLTESHTAKLALIVGASCIAAATYRPLWVERGLAAASIILMGWPFYAQCLFTARRDAVEQWHNSWRHRMEIWDYLSYRIAERPWFGWGLGTTHKLDFTQPHGNLYIAVTEAAPHAHNFITEIEVETGMVGGVLCLAFLLLTLNAAGRMPHTLRPFALGGWAAALVVALFGFDFWTDSLWGAFALSAFAFGMIGQSIERGNYPVHA